MGGTEHGCLSKRQGRLAARPRGQTSDRDRNEAEPVLSRAGWKPALLWALLRTQTRRSASQPGRPTADYFPALPVSPAFCRAANTALSLKSPVTSKDLTPFTAV